MGWHVSLDVSPLVIKGYLPFFTLSKCYSVDAARGKAIIKEGEIAVTLFVFLKPSPLIGRCLFCGGKLHTTES